MRLAFLTCCLFLSTLPARSQFLINEYLSSNVNGIQDQDYDFSDWIELYNSGSTPLDITGYALTDDKDVPAKWTFPSLTIPANKHILVFASDKNRKEFPMRFETIIDVGDEWNYLVPDSDIGTAWYDIDYNDSAWTTSHSSFGYSDNDDSTVIASNAISVFIRKKFDISSLADLSRLILSIDYDDGFVAYINGHEVARANLGNPGEYMAFNRLATTGREALMYQGGLPEYFDISNLGSVLVEGTNVITIQVHNNIAGSSDLSLIPFLTMGHITEGVDNISPFLSFSDLGGLHTNFKLDADSDRVFLYNNMGVLLDSTPMARMTSDVSYGRKPDGGTNWSFFGVPTPGAVNSTNGTGQVFADTVLFYPEGGMHPADTPIELSSANGSDTIYYTLDGSIPDAGDLLYTGPIVLHTSEVIRARVIRYNALPGPIGTRTYVTGLDHDIPIVCLSTEPLYLWDEMSGIYALGPNPPGDYPYFGANFWKDWERPVHMELYDVDGIERIDQDAGMKIFGAWSRASDQKSVSLFARKTYDKGSFKYKFFADKPIEKFESIILRNSGNDNMGLQFHDCFMTGLTREMNIDRQAYQPAAIYLNGQYWGLLNIREKVSNNYVAENHHVDPDSVNLLEGGGSIIDGNNEAYFRMTNFVNTKTTLQNSADFNWVQQRMDMDNFIQYQLTEIYLNNRDWPGNNIKFWNTTSPLSKWRWIIYDTDFGYGIWDVNDYMLNTLEFALEPNGPDWPNPPWATLLLRRLVTNTGFRNNFIIQYCDRLNRDLSAERALADLDSLQALYDNEIVYNFNRWWSNYDEWLWRLNNHKTFAMYRPDYCRQHMQSKFQLGNQFNIRIDVSDAKAGKVKLNTIYPYGYPFSGIYFENIPITMTAVPKPGFRFVRWEGSIASTNPTISYNMAAAGNFKAIFTPAVLEDYSVVINEINYSSSPEKDTKDWVELFNNGAASVDLTGWLLIDSGADSGFVFAQGTTLAPGEFLVICRNLNAFRSFNPEVTNSTGNLQFGLSSDGDIVRLFDTDNRLIDAVNYGVITPWPDSANSTGASIQLMDPDLNNSLGENWRASEKGPTPGKRNYEPVITETSALQESLASSFTCFPNPFRDFTTISFDVATGGHYRLEVLDMQGRVIKELANRHLDSGSYWIDWTGEGENNSDKGAGIYMIRLSGDRDVVTRKVVRLSR